LTGVTNKKLFSSLTFLSVHAHVGAKISEGNGRNCKGMRVVVGVDEMR